MKNVTSDQTWEDVLPLIISDPRYRVIKPLARRKAFFEKYVKRLASEEKVKLLLFAAILKPSY